MTSYLVAGLAARNFHALGVVASAKELLVDEKVNQVGQHFLFQEKQNHIGNKKTTGDTRIDAAGPTSQNGRVNERKKKQKTHVADGAAEALRVPALVRAGAFGENGHLSGLHVLAALVALPQLLHLSPVKKFPNCFSGVPVFPPKTSTAPLAAENITNWNKNETSQCNDRVISSISDTIFFSQRKLHKRMVFPFSRLNDHSASSGRKNNPMNKI